MKSNRGVKAGTKRGKYNTEGRDILVGMVSVRVPIEDSDFYDAAPDPVKMEIRKEFRRIVAELRKLSATCGN